MQIPTQRYIFLKYEADSGDNLRQKTALQDLSKLYRAGYKLNAQNRNSFELTILGLSTSSNDKKVIRWCLNCLARLGTRENSADTVGRLLSLYADDPEITAAAIAALSFLYHGQLEAASEIRSIDPTITTLAAMQNTDPSLLNVSNVSIDLDNSDTDVLKLALITVGLNKDIENLFHPRHSNGQIVKALGQHDDQLIRQYSVWSVLENKSLTIGDLGIPYERLEHEPTNVQSKIFQLAAEKETDVHLRQHLILQGSCSSSVDARVGLGKGLSSVYFDGLETITLNWCDTETNFRIKELLGEHFARFSVKCAMYEDKAIELVEADPKFRERILAGAESKPLFRKLKQRDVRTGTADFLDFHVDPIQDQISKLTKSKSMIRVLFLATNPPDPSDGTQLRLDVEIRDIREHIRLIEEAKKELKFDSCQAVRADQIQLEIQNCSPEILHISGHGDNDALIFEDKNGKPFEVSGDALVELISLSETIKCVVLNSCFSDTITNKLSPHLSATIGCNQEIDDEAAAIFARAFYRSLSAGNDYATAFKFAKNDVSLNGMRNEAVKYTLRTPS